MIVLGRTNMLESSIDPAFFKSLAALQIRLQLDAGKWGYSPATLACNTLNAIPPQRPLLQLAGW